MITIQGTKYMSDFEAKKAIIEVGKRMYTKGFVAANDGNISCRVGPNAIWATPTGVSKGFMTPEMLVKMDMNGKVLIGSYKPSSEMKMHLRVYHENSEVMAVTHAHPPVATSFAIAGIGLDRAILPEAVVQLGSVPIAHYATPGTQDVPDSIAPYCKTHNGVLLANHGALSWGNSIFQSFYRLESIEYYATVLIYTGNIIGKANELSCTQVDELLRIRHNLGIRSGGVPPCSINESTTKSISVPVTATTVMPQNNTSSVSGCGCSVGIKPQKAEQTYEKTKEELIAEVVRRVTEQVTGKLRR